ncbi:hypothetical protein CFIMG_000347RA [Ceratocystis fimbriata CBS 114723]|uniref:GPI-anchored cupredoxin n=1 Tax=Ceratocystis fimbriata CBS 114723 TaxID=1035309 RepID=A0A2C5X8S1_9PEZI|nr:hypothetical protein CFIMG_000347RA [Ceratocystis fimbriata CBS 114723]
MKLSTLLAAAIAPVVLAKTAATKFPVIKREDVEIENSRQKLTSPNLLSSLLQNKQNPNVIVVLWNFPGGNAATTPLEKAVTVTQTVTAPPADAAATPPPQDNKKDESKATTGEPPKGTGAAAVAPGATHTVTVGGPQGLSYFPDSVQAAVGDVIKFEFLSQNHTITQSTFDTPCAPLAGGMDSGFIPNPNNTVVPPPAMAMQVMTTEPLWMFCAQGNHCGRGMVFSINPNAAKTHAQFQARAINSTAKGLVGSKLTGGSGVPAVAAPAATGTNSTSTTISPPSNVQTGIVTGTGTLQADGSCLCSVQCGTGAFPVAAQGVGAFGGTPGSISMAQSAGIVPPPSRRLRRSWAGAAQNAPYGRY